jgi:dimethylargininase
VSRLDRLFQAAFVRPPSNSYVNCVSLNPKRKEIDVTLAKEQHRVYVSLLKESGIQVYELPALETYPDSVFMQDPAILGANQSVLGRFGEAARMGETRTLVDDLTKGRPAVGPFNTIAAPGTLEGGDVVISDRGIFVGESKRTNSKGIQQLTKFLGNQSVTSVRTKLMHLLCGCSYLSNGNVIIAPDLISPEMFPDFKFIKIPNEEAYASDALYLGAGKVLIPSGFPRTVAKLEEAGYVPVEIDV